MKTIKSIFEESVEETAVRLGIVNEMSIPLKDYKNKIDGLRFQLVENWCLCIYCQMIGGHPTFRHWCAEFKACVDNLKKIKIKNDIDKKKILIKMLIQDYDYEDVEMIELIIRDKFEMENIDDEKILEEVARSFTEDVRNIIDLISDNSLSVHKYCVETFE